MIVLEFIAANPVAALIAAGTTLIILVRAPSKEDTK